MDEIRTTKGSPVNASSAFYIATATALYWASEWSQQHPDKFPLLNSAFIRFNKRLSISLAETAIRARIRPSWTLKQGTEAGDMIWSNVSMSWWQQFTRTAIVYFLVTSLILGFALPVAIAGSISQVGYLANVVPGLSWIGLLPSWQLAIIQGVLPPAMLSLITAMAPLILRLLANLQGLYSRRAVENHVQFYYFTFLFVQIFLTVSLSAGLTTTIEELADSIQSIPTVLAENLPKASNYFFSYIMMHALTTFALTLVQANGLIDIYILSPALDRTARQKWMREQNSGLLKWGTFIPVLTNIACIVFCTIYFGGLWMIYRSHPPKLSDQDLGVGGIFFPTAVRQLLTGIYFMELCLAGLFFLVRDAKENAACRAHGIIMIIVVGFTALFHYDLGHENWLNWLSSTLGSKPQPAQAGRTRGMRSSTADIWAFQDDLNQDKSVTSVRPILWIPKDARGIANDEIYHMTRTHSNIWINSEGAHLDGRGCITLDGKPPEVRGDQASMTA
ncbi:hypothetical protein V493_00157 [Pseudogymnoascus sp. VKM F-4281 (FW-2241)]|nr:hypothetical protein V493_00157 [Pseudogymnoascus sp. VKM F-4281 (FW-2241)]